MRLLRSERGCPWDRDQSLESLKPYVIEEAYEVTDAIEAGDPDRLREELGDLLLQIVFQAQIAREAGWFTFEDVADGLVRKLIRRHPHVFGEIRAADAGEVLRRWAELKRSERSDKGTASILDGLPRHLPALRRAQEAQRRAARVGFDWNRADEVVAKIGEELRELERAREAGAAQPTREEFGDLLFSLVNLARFLGLDAEEALQDATNKFIRRFQELERALQEQGRRPEDCTLEELDRLWNEVKRHEQG